MNPYDEEKTFHNTNVNMYTPGINTQQPPPDIRTGGNFVPPAPVHSGKLGVKALIFAVCLLFLCTIFSAAASFLIIEFRIMRGDFTHPAGQVVLGGIPSERSVEEDYNTAPLIISPEGTVTAQEIYDLALTQVVGVSMSIPESFGSFGTGTSVPSVVGSGFIISEDGYILTNYHVIELAHTRELPISVVLYDGDTYNAKIIGFDASRDVALIKIEKTGLSPVFLGDSTALRVGQSVYAVGNPFGDLVYTMTDGIVSALDRIVTVDNKTISAFQFSAAVNSGNSGGPVYNEKGEVIGIVTAKVVRGNVEGIGFAIPINDAVVIATSLIEDGYISGRPLFGVTVRTVTSAHAEYYDLVTGILIRAVNPDSAAEKAGITVGDIITAIDDEEVDSIETLRDVLRQYNAGDTATVSIWRDGEELTVSITFDEDMSAGRPDITPPPTPDSPDPLEQMP